MVEIKRFVIELTGAYVEQKYLRFSCENIKTEKWRDKT